MQAIYLLEMNNMTMQRIGPPDEMLSAQSIAFSADSALIVVASLTPFPYLKSNLEVFERNGDRCSCFRAPFCKGLQMLAMLKGGRSAIAQAEGFSVWELRTGKLLGAVCPASFQQAHTQHYHVELQHAAFVIASAGGAKLAFKARSSSDMHVYDANTLSMLGVVSPFPCIGFNFELQTVVWGPYNGMIWERIRWDAPAAVHIIQPLKHQAGRSPTLYSVRYMHLPHCRYAMSPDGALLCLSSQDEEGLAIIDTRTGLVVATIACSKYVCNVCWSSCGRWIILGTMKRHDRTAHSPECYTQRLSIVTI